MTGTTVVPISVIGRGNVNTYLVVDRQAVLIDTGMPGTGPKIQKAMARNGIRPDDISAIVITHGHIDHYGSAAYLRHVTRAPITAHTGDSDAYTSGRSPATLLRPTGPLGRLFAHLPQVHQSTQGFEPDIQIHTTTLLHDYGVDARILCTPGSIPVLTDPGELIAGDMIAGPFLGVIRRRPANPPFHHDRTRNLASLTDVLTLNPTIIHVGHGGPLKPAHVRRWILDQQRKLEGRPMTR
jgi:glyoxylase-like metal-dependent hydrolase (beta-lactamase superfamily II)